MLVYVSGGSWNFGEIQYGPQYELMNCPSFWLLAPFEVGAPSWESLLYIKHSFCKVPWAPGGLPDCPFPLLLLSPDTPYVPRVVSPPKLFHGASAWAPWWGFAVPILDDCDSIEIYNLSSQWYPKEEMRKLYCVGKIILLTFQIHPIISILCWIFLPYSFRIFLCQDVASSIHARPAFSWWWMCCDAR